MVKARKLNDRGQKEFYDHIIDLRDNPSFKKKLNQSILSDDKTSEKIDISVSIDPNKKFNNLWELTEYLDKEIGVKDDLFSLEYEGFFAWLAALYFDQLRKEKPRAATAYICANKVNEFSGTKAIIDYTYRHVVRGPLYLLRKPNMNRHLVEKILFNTRINEWSDIAENFCGRIQKSHMDIAVVQEFILEKYFDKKGKIKTACTNNNVQGGIRRLAKPVLPRLINVLDVESLDVKHLADAWGPEFNKSNY